MRIQFAKMHGLGNDFMVIDGVNQKIALNADTIASLAHRTKGIGFDQCLLVEPAQDAHSDFTYRIFNADGQEVGQCLNGARCLALFVHTYGLTNKKTVRVSTKTTSMRLHLNEDNSVSVTLGQPRLAPREIPFIAECQARDYALQLTPEHTVTIQALSVGNPHALILVDSIATAPVDSVGRQISLHPRFPEQTNAGFMQIINDRQLRLRVYERGCGETQACGSGAVAAAAIGRLYHNMAESITVSLPGGDLRIDWPDTNKDLLLTGPAVLVYDGTIY